MLFRDCYIILIVFFRITWNLILWWFFFASEEILFSAVSFYLLMYGAKVKLAYPWVVLIFLLHLNVTNNWNIPGVILGISHIPQGVSVSKVGNHCTAITYCVVERSFKYFCLFFENYTELPFDQNTILGDNFRHISLSVYIPDRMKVWILLKLKQKF